MSALLSSADAEVARACDEAAARWCGRAEPRTQSLLVESWEDSIEAYLTIGISEANAVHREWLEPYRDHYDPMVWQRARVATVRRPADTEYAYRDERIFRERSAGQGPTAYQ